MNKLVEEIIKPILESNPKIKKVIGVYGGRFQPFGPHHYKTYKWLSKQVDEAYITTSNIKKPPRHPMNFKEKVRHMSKMGVPSSRIVEERTPLVAANLLKKFNPKTTAVVYIFGAKDAGRLKGGKKKDGSPGYFQDYKKHKRNIKGHEEHGYFLVAPHVTISVGGKEVSGTSMRELLGSSKIDDSDRAKLFKKMFGYYDKGVFQMMVNKFKKLFEKNDNSTAGDNHKFDFEPIGKNAPEGEEDLLLDNVSSSQLAQVEKYLDKLWDKVGVDVEFTRHFMDRVNDRRNDRPITSAEVIRIFKQTYKKYGKQIAKLGKGAQALMKDMKTDVNVPFVLYWNGTEMELRAKTIMRKKNFKSSNKKFAVEDVNVVKKKGKDGGDYRDYDSEPDSDWEEPYKIKENVKLDIKVGDTIMMGRFKNKRVKIKSIDVNDKGDLLINGRAALKFRMPSSDKVLLPKPPEIKINPYDDEDIKEFLTTIDFKELVKEASYVRADTVGPDDGPTFGFGTFRGYRQINKREAEKLGWEIVNLILHSEPMEEKNQDYPEYEDGDGPIGSVSYGPAGVGSGKTPNNQEDLQGSRLWMKYDRHIQKIAQLSGMEFVKFVVDKETKRQMAKDSKQTIKQGTVEQPQQTKNRVKGREKQHDKMKVVKESLTKNWWKETIKENLVNKTQLKPRGKELLLMGGAYGHMAHPFDDKDLTFGDLKKIITLGLGGQLNREDNVSEKLDGQNIMVSWKDGKLIAARNKGHIKNGGQTALDAKGIASKFKGRGNIRNAFVYAMRDLEKAVSSLSQKQKDKIFNNGYNFMNLEVMWPKSANVIDYDVATLVFHGALKYDDNAKVIGEVPGSGRMLQGMIQQVNQHIQKHYSIGKPQFLTIPKHQDFGKMKDKYLGRLSKLQSKFGLKDSDEVALYHQNWWEQFILKQLKKISPKVLKGLVKRWAFFDKSYKIPQIKQDLKDEPIFLEWVLSFDKNDHSKQVKENMKPFEILFFQVGAEILKNAEGYIAANPSKAVQGIRKRLKKAISSVKSGGDLKKLATLKAQLEKLNAIGMKNIVPSEGIVFKYKGKTYKFTGAFAPINQITGLMAF